MIIRQTCVYLVMVSGILSFAGCYILADRPQGEAQLDSTTLGTQSKSLAGSYRDVGSNGSIKPHPQPSYGMSQEPQSQTTGEMTLGAGIIDAPDKRISDINKSTGPLPLSGSGSKGTGSSSGASGAGRR